MESKLDRKQVEQVAKLGRLALDESEIEEFSGQLSSIIGYVEKMGELDTDGVEPLAHGVAVTNVFREDVVKNSLSHEEALRNSPDSDGEFFLVPKILDEGSGA
jgi:aspartyl-tRNA(Asn)/glutamyl-tRNA(Gln) amidotransferase subunit C